jgi:hypothetical protein
LATFFAASSASFEPTLLTTATLLSSNQKYYSNFA